MGNLKKFTSGDVAQSALKDKGIVLVDFWAPWCGPCRALGPVIEELAQDYAGRLTVGKVNIDEETEAAAAYRVASIPTVLLFVDGVEKERMIGARGKEAFEDVLDKYLA